MNISIFSFLGQVFSCKKKSVKEKAEGTGKGAKLDTSGFSDCGKKRKSISRDNSSSLPSEMPSASKSKISKERQKLAKMFVKLEKEKEKELLEYKEWALTLYEEIIKKETAKAIFKDLEGVLLLAKNHGMDTEKIKKRWPK